jgi:hypothetical protein
LTINNNCRYIGIVFDEISENSTQLFLSPHQLFEGCLKSDWIVSTYAPAHVQMEISQGIRPGTNCGSD